MEEIELLALETANRGPLHPAVVIGSLPTENTPPELPILLVLFVHFVEALDLEIGQSALVIPGGNDGVVRDPMGVLHVESDGNFVSKDRTVSFAHLLNRDLFVTLQQFAVGRFLK